MLKKLKIENFTCFSKSALTFSKGLNVIVGENGTGKSHLLKLCYAVLRSLAWPDASFAKEAYARDFAKHLTAVFRADRLGRLASRVHGHSSCTIRASWPEKWELVCNFSPKNTERVHLDSFSCNTAISLPLFLPPKEILSVYSGFYHAISTRELHFDATYLDLAKALSAKPLKGPRKGSIASSLELLEQTIGGTVKLENDAFYYYGNQSQKNSVNKRLEAPLMAEGHRKLGMLVYLLQTGGLQERSSLFWDEPESNLNPCLIKKLASILVDLSKIMQITVATHSLFLLRELEIMQEKKSLPNVRYFGLHFAKNGVDVTAGDSANDIGDLAMLDASIAQSEEYLQCGM
ncbi:MULTISPECIES: AAA family ATPase [unclassified Desulfovibrio]|uniref:AAA family ATPase n=1 Tax=unclassified Desulfovibrio TaxID=2593640 RepID=UPI000F5D72D4|nr:MULTISPECIES: AAA family ATPase [unclassified Desulfovibrio]RRD69030.1 ATP-binding protein [Desulfovibrio sp. OH1209_COT-279]RRD84037.1 ATP-binding protein [Desulfovibrio sp. OH1186_COT-070]